MTLLKNLINCLEPSLKYKNCDYKTKLDKFNIGVEIYVIIKMTDIAIFLKIFL